MKSVLFRPPRLDEPSVAALTDQVRRNCEISSAGQAGGYSLCGLLLRLRQFYKWEHGLAPWQEPDPGAVISWIEEKEQGWNLLEDAAWHDLSWEGAAHEPFEVQSLNDRLLPRGLAYGAGLSRGLTPTFFLGELLSSRREENLTILVLGRELARDLDAAPALRQGDLIYARREALAFYLWDRLSDPVQQKNAFLRVALEIHRLPLKPLLQTPGVFQEEFQAFLDGELAAAIHHEMGEAREPALRDAFPTVLTLFPQTRIEIWLRALKDALADVNDWGRLSYFIREQRLASLAVLLAWRSGLSALLLPELEPAFREVAAFGNWKALEQARLAARARLRALAVGLNTLLAAPEAADRDWLQREIQARYLTPLGL